MLFLIFGAAALFMILERLRPDQPLPHRPGWWARAVALNLGQLGAVVVAGLTWDRWLGGWSLFGLPALSPALGGLVGYLVTTFGFYWWHRARHASQRLWRVFHQVHHSPTRLETITSFYKHPAEQLMNGLLTALISYSLLGLSVEAAAWATGISAVAEFFYHMNVATPRWLGYLFQRPEMHRIHHEAGRHQDNYADLPVWDLLFGTFRNPPRYDGPCGFGAHEARIWEMLRFRDLSPELEALPKEPA